MSVNSAYLLIIFVLYYLWFNIGTFDTIFDANFEKLNNKLNSGFLSVGGIINPLHAVVRTISLKLMKRFSIAPMNLISSKSSYRLKISTGTIFIDVRYLIIRRRCVFNDEQQAIS